MAFLEQFTLYDVFLVALGLVIASIIRIFYDSYKERKKLEALDELVAVYNESMNAYDEGVIIISDTNEILFSNKEAHRILQKGQDALTMDYLDESVSLRRQNSLKEENFLQVIAENLTLPNAQLIIAGYTLPVAVNSNTFHIANTTAKHTLWRIVTIQDIAAKVKLQEKMESTKFSTDMLTELPVRHHLSSKLLTVVSDGDSQKSISALGMLGISDYHHLQSKYGVEKIDMLLKAIARTLMTAMQKNETLYRFDHDTLAIVFEAIEHETEARERLAILDKRIENCLLTQRVEAHVLSAIYMIRAPYPSVEQVVDRSLHALYYKSVVRTKSKEKTIQSVGKAAHSVPLEKLGKKEFREAIKNNDFFFFYQPIYSLKDDTLIGVEVLSRLNYQKEGLLLPEFFLQQAIECHMMTEVTAHLLDRVFSQKRFWSMQTNMDLDTTINLGISDIRSGVFTEMLEKKILEYEINPSKITIDISEEILELDYQAVFEECYMLNKLGVKLAIDHFGQGSISLKHISALPLYAIKMGHSLIEGIAEKEEKLRLVSGVISLGRKLDLEVGATFVDSDTVKTLLRRIHCHFVQGNYLGKAVPAFEITDLIHKR